MPVKVFDLLPTPLNTANDLAASGFVNTRTYEPVNAGGLTIGDVIYLTNEEAFQNSSLAVGTLFTGGYLRVRVDANATALNVAKGKAAYIAPGTQVFGLQILTAGTGQTPGTYLVAASGGGGTGAIAQIVVAAGGTVTQQPVVTAKGSGYTTAPTFTLAAGGTPATFQAQMAVGTSLVTSRDKSGVNLQAGRRGVFLNSITPGNYGWIQISGLATVLYDATTTTAAGDTVTPLTPTDGTFRGIAAATAPLASAYGTAYEAPIASSLGRVILDLPNLND